MKKITRTQKVRYYANKVIDRIIGLIFLVTPPLLSYVLWYLVWWQSVLHSPTLSIAAQIVLGLILFVFLIGFTFWSYLVGWASAYFLITS